MTAITNDTGSSNSDFRTNDTTLVFSGTSTAADDSRVEIHVDGVRVGAAVVKSGAWSFDNSANALADGSHAVRADLVDAAGNVARSSLVQTVIVDLGHPGTPKILGFTSDASSPVGAATNDPTPTMTGTAEPNSVVTIKNGTSVVGRAPVDGSGAWTFTPAKDLPEGSHVWSVIATDAAGTRNCSLPPTASSTTSVPRHWEPF